MNKANIQSRTEESQQKIAQVQEQLETVRKDLHSAEGGGKRLRQKKVDKLDGFIGEQIVELESELSCFELPAKTAPIFKCSDDHLICR